MVAPLLQWPGITSTSILSLRNDRATSFLASVRISLMSLSSISEDETRESKTSVDSFMISIL